MKSFRKVVIIDIPLAITEFVSEEIELSARIRVACLPALK